MKTVGLVLAALERYGPLCLSQLYTVTSARPAEVSAALKDLLARGFIEVRETRTISGLEEELRVYALRTGASRVVPENAREAALGM